MLGLLTCGTMTSAKSIRLCDVGGPPLLGKGLDGRQSRFELSQDVRERLLQSMGVDILKDILMTSS